MSKKQKAVLLTGNCSDKRCENRSVAAERWSNGMWVEMCEKHKSGFMLDMSKVGLPIDIEAVRERIRTVNWGSIPPSEIRAETHKVLRLLDPLGALNA